MKYMNMKNKYWSLNLQLFAGEGDEGDGGDAGDDDDSDDGDDDLEDDDDPDEKKFSQKDLDDYLKKRLGREKRKWQREQKKENGKDGASGKDGGDGETDTKVKEAESRALKAETRVACFEAGVDKDAIDDVTALAHAYMSADEDLDLEDAIEKVVKKYPHFKKAGGSSEDNEDGNKGKAWGQRQRGSGSKGADGVEKAFLEKNPGLKI